MKCPHCEKDLLMTERSGVEIDYCPGCRGIWLDRGELDKIIEKSAQDMANHQSLPPLQQPNRSSSGYSQQRPMDSDDRDRYDRDDRSGYGHGKKRGSFLSNLFDFD
jgi:Zn-finger nucleic acid-binding protein